MTPTDPADSWHLHIRAFAETIASAWSQVRWYEWATAVFDLVKGIAWPLVVFLIVWTFRVQIREKIKDVVSAGPGGIVLQPQQSADGLANAAVLPPENHSLETVNQVARNIAHEIEMFVEPTRIPRLISALAQTRVQVLFEQAFSSIFQTQIEFL